jgi:hypothetical protein
MFIQHAQASVVLVTSANPDLAAEWGTAFVIHSDDTSTYLLTCAHVVHDLGGNTFVMVGEHAATVVASGGNDIDVAVLRVNAPLKIPAISLCTVAYPLSQFHLQGLSKLASQFQSNSLSGRLGKAVTLFSRGSLLGHRAWELTMDSSSRLQFGQSGSPVLTDDGKCIAIAALRKGQGELGIAISIGVLRHIWPDRPAGILSTTDFRGASSRGVPRANLNDEVDAFERIVCGVDADTKAIIVHAASGMGKTRLLDEYVAIADHYQLNNVRVRLHQQIDVEHFLSQLTSKISIEDFRNFGRYRREPRAGPFTLDGERDHCRLLAINFFDDLLQSDRQIRLLALIDQYEKADALFKEWFGRYFLPKIALIPQLLVVVAGQEEAAPHICEPHIRRLALHKPQPMCWVECTDGQISLAQAEKLYKLFDGLPYDMAIGVQVELSRT